MKHAPYSVPITLPYTYTIEDFPLTKPTKSSVQMISLVVNKMSKGSPINKVIAFPYSSNSWTAEKC